MVGGRGFQHGRIILVADDLQHLCNLDAPNKR